MNLLFLVGKIEVFSKHDHTQFRLLASVDDQKYNPTVPLQYISFASFNDTPIQFYYDCTMTPTYIDTETAKRYANPGHPLLIEDPAFRTPIDKRNCKCFFRVPSTIWSVRKWKLKWFIYGILYTELYNLLNQKHATEVTDKNYLNFFLCSGQT